MVSVRKAGVNVSSKCANADCRLHSPGGFELVAALRATMLAASVPDKVAASLVSYDDFQVVFYELLAAQNKAGFAYTTAKAAARFAEECSSTWLATPRTA